MLAGRPPRHLRISTCSASSSFTEPTASVRPATCAMLQSSGLKNTAQIRCVAILSCRRRSVVCFARLSQASTVESTRDCKTCSIAHGTSAALLGLNEQHVAQIDAMAHERRRIRHERRRDPGDAVLCSACQRRHEQTQLTDTVLTEKHFGHCRQRPAATGQTAIERRESAR